MLHRDRQSHFPSPPPKVIPKLFFCQRNFNITCQNPNGGSVGADGHHDKGNVPISQDVGACAMEDVLMNHDKYVLRHLLRARAGWSLVPCLATLLVAVVVVLALLVLAVRHRKENCLL